MLYFIKNSSLYLKQKSLNFLNVQLTPLKEDLFKNGKFSFILKSSDGKR